jgi:hypothetical protein
MSNLKKCAALSGLMLVGSSVANAAVDAAVTTAITDAQADIVTVGSAIIVMAAAVLGLKWLKAQFF